MAVWLCGCVACLSRQCSATLSAGKRITSVRMLAVATGLGRCSVEYISRSGGIRRWTVPISDSDWTRAHLDKNRWSCSVLVVGRLQIRL
ncbi:hypothetical protein P170DRAFT_434565 [Aspergillus steynii IBT 23096]|uniref:Uncharacterized protein n=1 Tax=Aspergillus steynii IBT 23096 TaxID=1392250 RepID=A0A2I2GIY8_9EURO|nr:uncharacterized protein P170DRAFT_434565 [Aspergillus steynii IBT 23096]PLB52839.1 hypothetical protein P170DRAFT_434565 [Aspergillus steynii IBT 23096]